MNDMTLPIDPTPAWLSWVVPVLAIVGALGAALIWVGRVILLPGIKKELEAMLADKFEEARRDVEARHLQNNLQFTQLKKQLDASARDRALLHEDLSEVKEDMAYLRGKSSGTFKRPPE